jgi:PEP-CTERM motif
MKTRLLWVALSIFGVAIAQAAPLFLSNVSVTAGPPVWSYTVVNDEPLGSPDYVYAFTLAVSAPVTVIGTPAGWDDQTDGASFVSWFNTDAALPYPHDIAPGNSLSGFQISSSALYSQSLSFTVSDWDHSLDQPGPTFSDITLAPSTVPPTPVPEPTTLLLFGTAAAGLIWRRRTISDKRVSFSE